MDSVVTFVMPAYNVEATLGRAVKSIKDQTVDNWRLIIIDDCSTDATLSIARALASGDPRIRVMQTERQSGSVMRPRCMGYLAAETEYVCGIDADDTIEPRFLEKMEKCRRSSGADIVCCTLYSKAGDSWRPATQVESALYGNVTAGRDCVKYTLDGWHLHPNGYYRRDVVAKSVAETERFVDKTCFCDEILTRYVLFNADRVAVCDAKYFYTYNDESITRKVSPKVFDFIYNNVALLDFALECYGRDSREYVLAQRQAFRSVIDNLRRLNRHNFDKKIRKDVTARLKNLKKKLDFGILDKEFGIKLRLLVKADLNLTRRLLKIVDPLMDKTNA